MRDSAEDAIAFGGVIAFFCRDFRSMAFGRIERIMAVAESHLPFAYHIALISKMEASIP